MNATKGRNANWRAHTGRTSIALRLRQSEVGVKQCWRSRIYGLKIGKLDLKKLVLRQN